MDVREKLVDIVCDPAQINGCIHRCNHPPCAMVSDIVDALIAHGVTVQEWISVDDRLPQENEPEGAICEQVQVLLDNGVVSTGWCNRRTKMWWHLNYGETDFTGCDYEHTPVIAWQPLAQPPKGE